MCSIIQRVVIQGFVFTAILMPALIITVSIKKYRGVYRDKYGFTFKALAALVIWMLLTFGMMAVHLIVAWTLYHPAEPIDPKNWCPPATYIGLHLVYLLVGCLLVYWMGRHRTKLP